MRTTCEECGRRLTLDIYDDETMVGGECKCGYYVTRYTHKARKDFDWL